MLPVELIRGASSGLPADPISAPFPFADCARRLLSDIGSTGSIGVAVQGRWGTEWELPDGFVLATEHSPETPTCLFPCGDIDAFCAALGTRGQPRLRVVAGIVAEVGSLCSTQSLGSCLWVDDSDSARSALITQAVDPVGLTLSWDVAAIQALPDRTVMNVWTVRFGLLARDHVERCVRADLGRLERVRVNTSVPLPPGLSLELFLIRQ